MFFALIVFVGAGCGGVLRYGTNLAAIRLLGEAFPFGTFLINVAGSFVMGLVAAAALARIGLFGQPGGRLFLMTGVLGGFIRDLLRLRSTRPISGSGMNSASRLPMWGARSRFPWQRYLPDFGSSGTFPGDMTRDPRQDGAGWRASSPRQ